MNINKNHNRQVFTRDPNPETRTPKSKREVPDND